MRWVIVVAFFLSAKTVAQEISVAPVVSVDFAKGERLDSSIWGRVVGVNTNTKVFYTAGDKNVSYENGALVLEARSELMLNPKFNMKSSGVISEIRNRDVSSASVFTKNYFKYGRIEVVARMPSSPGIQPAIWLQGRNKGQYGEIDIVEANGKKAGDYFATVHAGSSLRELKRQSGRASLSDGFHKYSAIWNEKEVVIAYDDTEVLRVPSDFGSGPDVSPLNQPMQLKVNIGGGSDWTGPIDEFKLPQRMEVRSIKIWKYSVKEGLK